MNLKQILSCCLLAMLAAAPVDAGFILHPLGTLGGSYSHAYGINDSGQVVGYSSTTGDIASHAFLYDGASMLDLNDLINSSLGITLNSARGITSSGQIIAQGTGGAYLLTPEAASVPEPTSLAIFGVLGLLAYGNRRRRAAAQSQRCEV
ncbi:HAF repeat-containing PEP-CTERM protein [Allorhodopirellula solitaria]|uniref:Ice-binding protein C-terminal domain-containing protein n=1 Tax=Allorhodopirellula solitaria TaxID=2527987 RepID=A0A5C5XWE2_9BACT|nr:HAF repeat-containing PEP-CTERM protein [Allorhodopirellula solitaria]TWT65952.1 hypothetical protein CA85_28110 [Allorhodopirellula solitaria]